VGQITNGRAGPPPSCLRPFVRTFRIIRPRDPCVAASSFLEWKNIGRLVTGSRRQIGDARCEIKGDALFADPEDETLGFLIGGDQPAVVFLEGYNFRCFCHMQNIGRWRRQFATES